MAPSSRRLQRATANTPSGKSTVTTKSRTKSVSQLSFGRVTKSSKLNVQGSTYTKVEKEAFQKIVEDKREKHAIQTEPEAKIPAASVQEVQSRPTGPKRKRDDALEEVQQEADVVRSRKSAKLNIGKKRRVHFEDDIEEQLRTQLLSPPASPRETTSIAQTLQKPLDNSPSKLPQFWLDLISMHAAFLKAMSLHFAHNGVSTPAEINALLESVTRLWKKKSVRKQDLQRMLGVYELLADQISIEVRQVSQKICPFKILTSGLGLNVRTNCEYTGTDAYSEDVLQSAYPVLIRKIATSHQSISDWTQLPLLTIALGEQTSIYRTKAATTRTEILGLAASAQPRPAPDFSRLSITESSEQAPASVKSRTLSLFDRVRAKGLASANNTAPTAEQITRRRAVGRINEVVEFLRMRQQQKLSAQFHSVVHSSPGRMNATAKVSFSLVAIVRDIRQSVGVPIGDEEVKVCLRILSKELPGEWCRMIEFGSVVSITLQGSGMSGVEVKNLLESRA